MAKDTIVTGSKLTAIADAIRAKTGGSSALSLDDMPSEITGISGADRLASRLMDYASSQEQDYAYDVTSSDWDCLLANQSPNPYAFFGDKYVRNVTLPSDKAGFTKIYSSMFLGADRIESITIPARTDGRTWSMVQQSVPNYNSAYTQYFFQLGRLKSLDLSNVASIAHYSNCPLFYECTSLRTLVLPVLASRTYVDDYDFDGLSSLQELVLPNGWAMSQGFTGQVWAGCTSLRKLDLSTDVAGLGGGTYNGTMSGCKAMEDLVLRSQTMVKLNGGSCLFGYNYSTESPTIPTGLKIWVPASIKSAYQADANWSVFASCFRDLEDYD